MSTTTRLAAVEPTHLGSGGDPARPLRGSSAVPTPPHPAWGQGEAGPNVQARPLLGGRGRAWTRTWPAAQEGPRRATGGRP